MSETPSPAESSIELIRRVQAGDDDALNRLCARYLPILQRWASGRLPARARQAVETADLVQDTLVQTLGNLGPFEHRREGAILAYLRTALSNRIRSQIRRVDRRPEEVDLDERLNAHPSPTPIDTLIGSENARRYETALASLRPVEREVIIARLEFGLSFAELADALEKPSADSARMFFRRAVLRLAEAMRDDA